MKLLVLFLCLSLTASSQESWKIRVNDKLILTSAREDEAKNVRAVKSARPNSLAINLTDKKAKKGWTRSIIIVDENDQELFRKDKVTTLRLNSTQLRKLLSSGKTLRIFTISLPDDPELAARIRVRRVHLCTLNFS